MKYAALPFLALLAAAYFLFWNGSQEPAAARVQVASESYEKEREGLLPAHDLADVQSDDEGVTPPEEKDESSFRMDDSIQFARPENPIQARSQRRRSLASTVAHRNVADFAKSLDERISGDYERTEWGAESVKAVEAILMPSGLRNFEFFSAECLEDFCYADIQTGKPEMNKLLGERVVAFTNNPPADMFDLALVVNIDAGLRRVYFFSSSFDLDRIKNKK